MAARASARKTGGKKPAASKRRAKATPTTLAPRGLKSRNGVSPSGFTLSDYVAEETYADREKLPAFLTGNRPTRNPCLMCPGECCRARVVLNVCDLVRLAAPLEIHPSSFCDLVECESRNGEAILIGETRKHITLRKGDDDHCVLQLKVDGHRRCGVHELRPGICRLYPFAFERGNQRLEMGLVSCPTRWLISAQKKDAILDDLESHEHDRALDRQIVRRWNLKQEEERTPQAFWIFALVEAGRELGVDTSAFTRQPPRAKLKPAIW